MYPEMQISLFNSCVSSVLSYGCEVWGLAEAKKIETIHLSFLKHLLKVKKSTPTCFVYKECNVYPLYYDRIFRIIKYWLKILLLEDNNPLKILYYTTIELFKNDSFVKSNCWAINIRNLLFKNGFGHIWVNQMLGVNKNFLNVFKRRIKDSFWQSINAEIESLSHNRLYRHLNDKSNNYLFSLPNNHIRTAITRLRLSSHSLNVERGRWKKIEYADRKCNVCEDIDDEYHFVVCCPRFHNLRIKYLPKSLYINPSMYKFTQYLNSQDLNKIKRLGIFLHLAFNKYTAENIFEALTMNKLTVKFFVSTLFFFFHVTCFLLFIFLYFFFHS